MTVDSRIDVQEGGARLGAAAVLDPQAIERLRELDPGGQSKLLVRVADADAVNARLKARKILVRNFHGSHPLLANCLRLTVGTPGENELLLDALTASL